MRSGLLPLALALVASTAVSIAAAPAYAIVGAVNGSWAVLIAGAATLGADAAWMSSTGECEITSVSGLYCYGDATLTGIPVGLIGLVILDNGPPDDTDGTGHPVAAPSIRFTRLSPEQGAGLDLDPTRYNLELEQVNAIRENVETDLAAAVQANPMLVHTRSALFKMSHERWEHYRVFLSPDAYATVQAIVAMKTARSNRL